MFCSIFKVHTRVNFLFDSDPSKQTVKSEKELLEEKKKNMTFKISSAPKSV